MKINCQKDKSVLKIFLSYLQLSQFFLGENSLNFVSFATMKTAFIVIPTTKNMFSTFIFKNPDG